MSDERLEAVWSVVERYLRGERTDAELADEAKEHPELGPVLASCLRCFPVAQELLEAIGRSPFDLDAGPRPLPAPTRAGLARWLERVRDGEEEPVAFCDWATDAFAWHDPARGMDPLVQDVLGDLSGSEDEVERLATAPDRVAVILAHLERSAAEDDPDRLAVGLAVHDRRDELLVALIRRTSGASDDAALRGELASVLAPVDRRAPGLVDALVAAAGTLAGDPDELGAVERMLDGLERSGDVAGPHG